jgi:hypothetical protein
VADVAIVNSTRSHHPRVPLGSLYLCAHLEANDVEVEFRDYQVCEGPGIGAPDQFASWLQGVGPILGISTLSSSLPLVLTALRNTRLRQDVECVILGGPGVGGLGPRILELFPEVDIVVDGEGESTLLDIVTCLQHGRSLAAVPGAVYRDGQTVRINGPRDRIVALDELAFPAYHHVNLADYTSRTEWDSIPLAVLSSRGCPYECSFCAIPGLWIGGIRYRSVANVVDEIELLKDQHGIERIHLTDDTFVMDRERVLDFCRLLDDRHLGLQWSCLGRVDRMDEEVVRTMALAGCDTIFYGIESGSDEILGRIHKRFTVAEAFDVVKLSLEYMKTHVSFIWGFPFETLHDLYDTIITLLLMHRMGAELHFNLLVPLPSAELHRKYATAEQCLRAADIGWDWALMDDYRYGPELLEFIRDHRDLCAPFYCFASPDFDEKVRLLESWGLGLGQVGDQSATVAFPKAAARDRPIAGRRLPDIASRVTLRNVGGREVIFDVADCLLYEPGHLYAEVFQACQRQDDMESVVARLSSQTGEGHAEVARFVQSVLDRFHDRGFLAH